MREGSKVEWLLVKLNEKCALQLQIDKINAPKIVVFSTISSLLEIYEITISNQQPTTQLS